MTDRPRDELGEATDRLVAALKALVPEDKHMAIEAFGIALSDWCAIIIGRATAQSASAVVALAEPQARKIKSFEKRLNKKRVDIADLQTIVEDHGQRIGDLERSVGDARH